MPIRIKGEKELLADEDVVSIGLFIQIWQEAKEKGDKGDKKGFEVLQEYLKNPYDPKNQVDTKDLSPKNKKIRKNKTMLTSILQPDKFSGDPEAHHKYTNVSTFFNGLESGKLYKMIRLINHALGNKVKLGRGDELNTFERTDFDNKDSAEFRNAILNSKALSKFNAEFKKSAEQKKVLAEQQESRMEKARARGRKEYKEDLELKARAKAEGKPVSDLKQQQVLEQKRRESAERKQREQQERQRMGSEAQKPKPEEKKPKEAKREEKKPSKVHDQEIKRKLEDIFGQSFSRNYLYQKKKFAHVFWTYKIRDYQLEFLDTFRKQVTEDPSLSGQEKVKFMSAVMDFMSENLEIEQKEHWTKAQSRLKTDVDERKRELSKQFKDILPTTNEEKDKYKRKMMDYIKEDKGNKIKFANEIFNEDARLRKKFKK